MSKKQENSAQSRTLPLLPHEPTIEPEERVAVTEDTEVYTDAPSALKTLLSWDSSDVGLPSVAFSVVKYRNGYRGLRFDRGAGGSTAEFRIAPDMWIALAQCIFRDSKILRSIIADSPEQLQVSIKQLREFMFTGKE